MGDSFLPAPGSAPPPPEPDTPAPDFGDIGAKIWGGAAAAVSELGGVPKWGDWILHIVAKIVGFLLSILVKIFAYAIEIIDTTLDAASDSFGHIIAATMKSLFGVEVDPASVNTRRGGPDRKEIAKRLGRAITNTLFTTAKIVPGGGLTPSDQAADDYLAVVMNMEVNGWIESFFADGITGHILEKYGDLKDGVARVLGLGRMSRAVFRAPLRILVSDPYEALLNQRFRPKGPNEEQVIKAFYRGEFDETSLSQQLGDQGYTEQQIKWAVFDHQKPLPLEDINYLLSRQVWTNDDASQVLQAQGFDFATAGHIVAILNDKRTYKYRTEMVSVAEAAYVRGDMDLTEFQQIVATLSLTQEEQTWISNLATLKRSVKVEHLSLGQIEQGIRDGVLSFADLQSWAARVNMPADEVAYLELMIQFQRNKETTATHAKNAAAAAKATAAEAKLQEARQKAAIATQQAADKGLSVAEAETLVLDGKWTFDQFRNFLTIREYGPDAVLSLVALLHDKFNKAAAAAAAAGTVRATAAAKGLSLADTEKAVVAGILTIDDLKAYLTAAGFTAADIQVIAELTLQAKEAADVKANAKAAAAAKAANKQLSLPDLERAVRAGLTSIATYNAALRDAGFDEMSITLLDGLLNEQIAADQEAAAKRAAGATAGAERGITLAQLEQEIINSIRPIADYSAALTALKYSAADAADLTALLQLKVDQAKATAAHRAAAGQQLQARDISLAQAERAVKLGVMPIAEYKALLAADLFNQHAIDVLTNSLLAEVAKISKAQQDANAAGAVLATKSISLPALERAVIAGVRPIAEYSQTLTANGYSATDVQTLTELLQLKVDQAAAAEAAHTDAAGAATERGLNLAQEEAAVIAGNITMDDYVKFLTALGYDVLDRAILTDLLQSRISAKADKEGTDTGPPAV